MALTDDMAVTTDPDLGAVIAVDTATGDRKIVSGADFGSGPKFGVPIGIAALKSRYYVSDPVSSAVFAVDPGDGKRMMLRLVLPGSEVTLQSPVGIGADGKGNLVVTDLKTLTVYAIDPNRQQMHIVSGRKTESALRSSGHGASSKFLTACWLSVTRRFPQSCASIVPLAIGQRSCLAEQRGGFLPV